MAARFFASSSSSSSTSGGYGDGYKYAHDYPGHFADLEFMPAGLTGKVFYNPAENRHEDILKSYLEACWPKYYKK